MSYKRLNMNICAHENTIVLEEIFRRNRWYVIVKISEDQQSTIPKAHYVWLKSNPAFIEIPKDYVIHHLNHDELNDDPTNLVLMQRFLHIAYHWKQKIVKPEVKIERTTLKAVYFDGDPDKIHIYPKGKRWYINWYANSERIRIFSWDGKGFKAKERAESARDHLIKYGFISR